MACTSFNRLGIGILSEALLEAAGTNGTSLHLDQRLVGWCVGIGVDPVLFNS